ncbi:MAG: DUF1566 domain-containing protein [bacterium]
MKKVLTALLAALLLLFVVGCGSSKSSGDDANSGDDGNTADSGDDGNTADSGDDGNTADSGDDGNTADSGDDGNTADTGDDGNTANSGDDGDTANSGDDGDTGDDDSTPVCGNGTVEEGEICDGNKTTCKELGLGGSEEDIECNGSCDGWITAEICKKTFDCSGKLENSVWNSVDSYTQTWDGEKWVPADSDTEYNEETSDKSCRYKCAEGFVWDGSNCVEECLKGQTQFVECGTDPGKWQKQICDEYGLWQDFENCVDYRSNVLCSSQTKCYDNSVSMTCPAQGEDFYGQDAQYAALGYCIPKSYTVSGTAPEEIVKDNNTGLEWQRTLPAIYDGCTGGDPAGSTCQWQDAVDYCNGLSYGGHSDWRLPTRKELVTLPDYGKYEPAIDTDVFPDTPFDYYFWSSSSIAANTDNAWHVRFNNGYVSSVRTKTNDYYARCVRGEEYPESTFEEVTISGEVVVKDSVTGLEWQRTLPAIYDGCTGGDPAGSTCLWQEALDYCETLDYGGYSDWRLPTIEELKTLIDDTKNDPVSSFPGMPSNIFWSSSSYVYNNRVPWIVYFYDGHVASSYLKTYEYYARCVR